MTAETELPELRAVAALGRNPLMMTPGPVEVHPAVLAAAARPVVFHLSPDFMAALDQTLAMLKSILDCPGQVIVLPGSGRVGMEAALRSLVVPGDPVLVIDNGVFGSWFGIIARRLGHDVTVYQGRWGRPLDLTGLERTLAAHSFRAVTVVHSETSSGAANPLAEIGQLAHRHGALCIVDAISSAGALPLSMAEFGIDACVAASQKALGGLLGIAVVGLAPRALEAIRSRSGQIDSFAFDLGRWTDLFFDPQGARYFPTPPPTHLVFALQRACALLLAEGLTGVYARHARMAHATRAAVKALGLALFPDAALASNSLTVAHVPQGVEPRAVVQRLLQEHGVLIAGPAPSATAPVVRIGHMNQQATLRCLLPTLAGLEMVLGELGHDSAPGTAVSAFLAALEQQAGV